MRDITMVNVDEINRCCLSGCGKTGVEGIELRETTTENTGKVSEFRYPVCESCISKILHAMSKEK